MKADLHMHTNFSDGKYSPSELLDLAINNNLDIVSITDHDTFDGVLEAITLKKDIRIILGIELSTYHNDESVHVLGYFKDLEQVKLMNEKLQDQIRKRKERAIEMLDKLEELFNIRLDRGFVDEVTSVTRGTIAREIIKQGYQYTHSQIFAKMLGDDCPAYIPSSKMETKYGVNLIHEHGGLAVLAHPMELKKNDPRDLLELGFDGVEAKYPTHLDEEQKYRGIAKEYNLFITSGTDFHNFNDGKHGNIGQTYLDKKDLEIFLRIFDGR